mmetsp:Transcript_25896/g.44000  ORF Transcript_25896/g.44000 Transcript_25896/m.44000 type:complete len:226 (+) Transcript_25896:289-966(+)
MPLNQTRKAKGNAATGDSLQFRLRCQCWSIAHDHNHVLEVWQEILVYQMFNRRRDGAHKVSVESVSCPFLCSKKNSRQELFRQSQTTSLKDLFNNLSLFFMSEIFPQQSWHSLLLLLQMCPHIDIKLGHLLLESSNLCTAPLPTLFDNLRTTLFDFSHGRHQLFMTLAKLLLGNSCLGNHPWKVDLLLGIMMFMHTLVEVFNVPLGKESQLPGLLVLGRIRHGVD